MKQLVYHEPKQLNNSSKLPSIQKNTPGKIDSVKDPKPRKERRLPLFYTSPIFKPKTYELW